MSKEKVKEIYGLIETKQEAIDLTRLGWYQWRSSSNIIIDNNQESALARVNNPTGENALHYAVVGYIRSEFPHIAI